MSAPASGERHKLRGSCHACALSKVKCSKEKPICSRCTKRGTSCEYLVTKRPGRKQQENRSNPKAPVNTTKIQEAAPDSTMASTFALPEDQPWSVPSSSPSCSDVLSSLFESADSSLSSALTDWSTDFDDYLANFSTPEPATFDALSPDQIGFIGHTDSHTPTTLRGKDSPVLVPPGDTISLFGRPVSASQTSADHRPLDASIPDQHHQKSTCNCLSNALNLFKELSSSELVPGAISGRRTDDAIGSHLPSIGTTIKTNQQTMDLINTTLQCKCSGDSYVLIIVVLIIFKVLERYATAATVSNQSPTTNDPSDLFSRVSETGTWIPSPTDQRGTSAAPELRITAAQRVLGELHRVQRALNQLSPALRTSKARQMSSLVDALCIPRNHSFSVFPNIVMDELEQELRKRLGTLSLEIINALRLEE
ncbi:hypothetical protein N7462_000558 [Penicillium macrosclerotiorum]|uniref:uncharacterized protein n=1 Tax=Penicillium macrosclerotiorum TaxID=303699 RepID=UPI00254708E1|nr:uncharacterized protein N7462_000558 [Penicillium macrosclerotiorum]KAJ5698553.1 hypothetical protein N7462_000558 [Penicillium macrosclerotiorum]